MKLTVLKDELNKKFEENPEMKKKIRTLSLLQWIESAYAYDVSSGNAKKWLRIDDIQKIIMQGLIDSKTLEDHILVKNYYDMIKFLYETVQENRKIDIEMIETINAVLNSDGTVKDRIVRYRKEEAPFVESIYVITPEPDYIFLNLNQFISDYNSMYNTSNPIHRACFVHNELLRVYPFEGYNEATARALLNFELISGGYLPIITNLDGDKYYEAINLHINEGNEKPFYELIQNTEIEIYSNYIELEL